MLIDRATAQGIADGTVTLAFRRWDGPLMRPGSRQRTGAGVVEVVCVKEVDPGILTEDDARAAGVATLTRLHGLSDADRRALGRETLPFKRDVRKLEELGLTHSLEVGYQLSPRGRAYLDGRAAAPRRYGRVVPEPVLPSTARLLLARTARAQRDGRAPGLVAGVVRGGGLAWSAGRGDVPEPHTDVQFRLGSISKTVTAIAVLRLRDEGRLRLDDPLERHLPGTPFGDRTIGQLLSHLAGASAESPGGWWERTPGGTLEELGLDGDDVVLGAARRFHYSNLGFGLLGDLAARLRGASWEDVVRTEVLEPLGMRRTTPRPVAPAAAGTAVHPWADVVLPEPEHHAGVMAAAGQLWATLDDLARFAVFLLGDTGDVLDPATLEEMTVPAGVDSSAPGWSSYGLGLQVVRVDDRTLVGHGGSMPGFLAGVFVDREEQTGAVSLANTTSGLDAVVYGLLGDLRAAEPRIVEPWRPSPAPVDLGLLGVWFWGPAPHVLRAVPGGLLHLGPLPGRSGRTSRFTRRPDGTWLGLDGYYAGETLRIAEDHLDLGTFVFTRTPYDPGAPVPGGVDEAGWR